MTTTTATTASSPTKRRSLLAVVAIVVLALAAAGCMPKDSRTFLDRTNSLRKSYGVHSLTENDTLTKKAEAWAQHMASTGRLEHSDLDAGLSSLNWRMLGENVGYSSPTSNTLLTIHNLFVASAPHKANLVNGRFTHMGVGVATDGRGRVWVAEVFAQL
ncbi:MAG: CAP domain-containing protein [Acidimicrobiales bacterium]